MAAVETMHLSDVEIDAYWKGQLAAADEERIEIHYLECAECRARVAAVETLVGALRLEAAPTGRSRPSRRLWLAAAAVFAVVTIATAWQWGRLADDPGSRIAVPEAVAPADGNAAATFRVAVEPPTRSASATPVALPSGAAIVLFDLDAREAGAPGTMFDVALSGPDARSIIRVAARSSADGRVEVPVRRSLLKPGRHQFEVTHQGVTVTLPLLIDDSQP